MSAAVGLLAGVAAGYAQARRQKKLDERETDYMDTMKRYRQAQMDRMSSKPMVDTMRSDIGADIGGVGAQPYARGGLVGASNSEMSEWGCDCARTGASSDWQKSSMKK